MRNASLRRRRILLRTTAPPTLRVIVKPNRAPELQAPSSAGFSGRRRPSIMNKGQAHRTPPRTRLNCDGRFRVSIAMPLVDVVSPEGRVATDRPFARPERPAPPFGAFGVRPTDACDPWRDAAPGRACHQLSTSACESHGGACERAGSADKSSSRLNLRRHPGPAAPRARPRPYWCSRPVRRLFRA